MEFSPLVILALGVGSILVVAGLGLIWVGGQRRSEKLPAGAHDVLAAIVDGRLELSDTDSWVRVVNRESTEEADDTRALESSPAHEGARSLTGLRPT